jgi:hypothetical protein
MTSKNPEKTSYAMNVQSASRQMDEAKQLVDKGIAMMGLFCCGDTEFIYKDQTIKLLAEYITNNNFYSELLQKNLNSKNKVKNKKTGQDNIVISQYDFGLINAYVTMTAACENELATMGISMRTH